MADTEELLSVLRAHAEAQAGFSCLVSDALGRSGAMTASVRPMWPGARLLGPAFTVQPHGRDIGAVFTAIDEATLGDVIVVANDGTAATAHWGENATLLALRRRLAGTVLGAPCRDLEAHQRLRYPLFATGATPCGGLLGPRGATRVPISVGGLAVAPGDIVVADENGVAVIPAARIAEVAEAVPALLERERQLQADIAAGRGIGRRQP